jgi:bacteriocin biosynthesis cyclodehydratase domain-containing protein
MRPILRPGTHVLSRAPGEVQLGLEPRHALVLPDSEPVRRTLRLLAKPAERTAYAAEDTATLDLLARQGLVVDQASVGDAAGRRTEAGAFQTQVLGYGHPLGLPLVRELVSLLRRARLYDTARGDLGPPDAGVLAGVGEPDRELVDAWTRNGTPYVLVRLTEGRAVVGPFVVPGRTACLRCIDAHFTDADRAWPLLVRQYAAAAAQDRADGAAEPVDPLLATVALGWAARDLATYVEGRRPSTWSTTVTLHPDLCEIETRSWLRHPGCSCTWE